MKVIEGSTRIAFLCFFLSHIPMTLLIDSQAVFGPYYYPQVLVDFTAWYCDLFGDVLMTNAPSADYVWFSSLICCEILFQVPFFFVAVKMMMGGRNVNDSSQSQHYPEWFRMSCIIYGTYCSTALVPIIPTFVASREMSIRQKCATIASKLCAKRRRLHCNFEYAYIAAGLWDTVMCIFFNIPRPNKLQY